MDVFNGKFLNSLKEGIFAIVSEALDSFIKNYQTGSRYLKQKEARLYVGGISYQVFIKNFVGNGLPEIRVEGAIRYDKKDLDDFMKKNKS